MLCICVSLCVCAVHTEKKRVTSKFLSGFSSIVRMQCNVCIEIFVCGIILDTESSGKWNLFRSGLHFMLYSCTWVHTHTLPTQSHTRKIKWNSRTGMLFALKSRSLYHHRLLLLSWYTVDKRNDYTIILCTHDAIKNYQIFMNVGVNVWNMCLSSSVLALVWFRKNEKNVTFLRKEGFLFIDWCQMWSTRDFFGCTHTHANSNTHSPLN